MHICFLSPESLFTPANRYPHEEKRRKQTQSHTVFPAILLIIFCHPLEFRPSKFLERRQFLLKNAPSRRWAMFISTIYFQHLFRAFIPCAIDCGNGFGRIEILVSLVSHALPDEKNNKRVLPLFLLAPHAVFKKITSLFIITCKQKQIIFSNASNMNKSLFDIFFIAVV